MSSVRSVNGDSRKQRLKDAGYDYRAIQKLVNQL